MASSNNNPNENNGQTNTNNGVNSNAESNVPPVSNEGMGASGEGEHSVVDDEKDNAVGGLGSDIFNAADNQRRNNSRGGLLNNASNLANKVNDGLGRRLQKQQDNAKNQRQRAEQQRKMADENPDTKKGEKAEKNADRAEKKANKLDQKAGKTEALKNKVGKVAGGLNKAATAKAIANGDVDVKDVAVKIAKDKIKQKVIMTIASSMVGCLPIIACFLVVILFVVIIAGVLGSDDGSGTIGLSSSDECGFSISSTTLTKSEFREKLTDYANNKNTAYKVFAGSNADTIYDIATSNGVNPELVVVRAGREGFSPKVDYNYWGYNCTNTGGGKDCTHFKSLGDGVKTLVDYIKEKTSVKDMMLTYSYIGKYWYTVKDSGLGGCYYASYIYTEENMPSRVSNACRDGAPTCTASGGSGCTATTDEDQDAYANWQVSKMRELRDDIFGEVDTSYCETSEVSSDVNEIMSMSDSEVWKGLTGTSTEYSSVSEETMAARMTTITVPIRVWASSSKNDYDTTTAEVTLTVNKFVAPIFEAFFNDVYNEATDFVIDKSTIGCYSYRNRTSGSSLSGHAYGAACDINPNVKGNGYGQHIYTESEWKKLSKSKEKYQIIYEGSKIVEIAHKYTLSWGGDWSSTTDAMHFSFIGDVSRVTLKANYLNTSE